MIAYDLTCHRGHQFESWFKNLKSFESQRRKKLIGCPRCRSVRIEIMYSARTIKKRSVLPEQASSGRGGDAAEIIEFIQKNFDDVGKDFAEEARRLHYGDSEPRSISGVTTDQEESDLREEGISFLKIAIPKPSN